MLDSFRPYGEILRAGSGTFGHLTEILTCLRMAINNLKKPRRCFASWVTVDTPTDRPKSVRNHCVIELSCGVVCVVTLPFWHFCWCRGFCQRTESDLFLFCFSAAHFCVICDYRTLARQNHPQPSTSRTFIKMNAPFYYRKYPNIRKWSAVFGNLVIFKKKIKTNCLKLDQCYSCEKIHGQIYT